MKKKELIQKAIKERNIRFLAEVWFGYELTPGQCDIVRRIAFAENRRLSISAMTRYGKTLCVAIGVAMYIIFHKNKRIALLAPQQAQTQIIRNYISELIMRCRLLQQLADIGSTDSPYRRLKREASRQRQTFKNGCEYRVFSASGEAMRLMGFGADVIVKDEACLIAREADAKIVRMLGDAPEESILIELYNPWSRDNVAFEHTLDPRFKTIRIDYRQAIKENRTTKAFIEEMRDTVTPLEFTVLYESRFPEEAEDSLYSLADIEKAMQQEFNLIEEYESKKEDLLNTKHMITEKQYKDKKKELSRYTKLIACDVADKGRDSTVIIWGIQKDNQIEVIGSYSEPKSENTQVAGRINNLIRDFIAKDPGKVNIDVIGVGTGVVSMVKEYKKTHNLKNVKIKGAHFGKRAIKSDKYQNLKAENYFRSRNKLKEGMIDLHRLEDTSEFKKHLMAMTWELTSAGKVRIIDPEDYSPDWADAFCYLVWKDTTELKFAFV